MRILVAWLLYLAVQGTALAQTPISVTVLCDASYPPYSYAENGEAKGLYSDILRAAFARMPGYRVSIRPVPWPRGLAALEKGTAFALFPPYYRPVERPWMDYSRPILEESVVAFVRSELAQQRAIEDFPAAYAGLRIGLNRGFNIIAAPDYKRMLAAGQVQQSYASDNRTNLLQLKRQRIDVYINDRLSILWELQQMRDQHLLGNTGLDWLVEGPRLSSEHGHLGYTRLNPQAYPYKQDFMQRLDQVLLDLEADGSIARLAAHYSALDLRPGIGMGHTNGNNL
ncbi:transporter substrate-binding domain-containing protein [Pseudomonas sp. LjRoot71]|uniref:substrate-binding periplasmic protein n=1 Tax=Pseudomonas sp. LjRoot71 TaxID=3342336 RepID=UPI003ECD594E